MIDFSTTYLGLKLNGPIVVSSTPISESIDNVARMEEAGASAIVLTSLFEEQLALESGALDEDLSRGTESFAESLGYLPDLNDYRMTHEVYLENLRRSKDAVDIPDHGQPEWRHDRRMGALRPRDGRGRSRRHRTEHLRAGHRRQPDVGGPRAAVARTGGRVCRAVKIPVAVKLSQSFTSIPHLVKRLEDAGARGVVLFNRFYQPDFDIETLEVRPTLHFSTPSELLPRLHWAAILYGHTNIDIGITGGVHSAEDVLKSIMAGGNVAMMASALHIHGIEHIGRVLADLRYWLEKREYTSLAETRGCLSRRSVPDTSPFDRGNYIKTLSSYSLRQTVAAF